MTKQEQIEEMVCIMAASNNPFVDVPVEIMPNVAEALYNAGYRKVTKDSVVLSREEYERITKELVTEQRATEIAKEYFEKIRKETAEKICKMLISKLDLNQFLSGKRIIMEVDVENLAKQFDVEIEW